MPSIQSVDGDIEAIQRTSLAELLVITAIFILCAVLVFDGVLQGLAINNVNHLFNFEPWYHYRRPDQLRSNQIMSDSIDWPNIYHMVSLLRQGEIPLWDFNEQLGKPGIFVMTNYLMNPVKLTLWLVFGVPIGWTIEILLRFIAGGVFMYLFLKQLGVFRLPALVSAVGFAFGTSSIGSWGDPFGGIPLAAPIAFFFIERIVRNRLWVDSLWLLLALFYIASHGLAHIAFFMCGWIAIYCIARVVCCQTRKVDLALRFLLPALGSAALFSYSILPTIEFFRFGMDLGYREYYGLRQLSWQSIANVFFAHVFGHPLTEAKQWNYGTFINTGMFVGFIAPLAILAGAIPRVILRRDFHCVFFLGACAFLLALILETPFERLEYYTNMLPLLSSNPPIYQKTILQFFIAVCGALGLQFLWNDLLTRAVWMRWLTLVIALSFCTLIFNVLHGVVASVPSTQYSEYYFGIVRTLVAVQLLMLIILFARGLFPLAATRCASLFGAGTTSLPVMAGVSLLLCACVEIVLNSRGWIGFSRVEDWYPDVELTKFLKPRLENTRIIPLGPGTAVPETLAAYGFPNAAGRGSVSRQYGELLRTAWPKIYLDHPTQSLFAEETKLDAKIWDLLNVKYFVATHVFPGEKLIPYGDRVIMHRLYDSSVLERVSAPSLVHFPVDAVVVRDPAEMGQQFSDDSWFIDSHVMVDSSASLLGNDRPTKDVSTREQAGKVISLERYTNAFDMAIEVTRPCYLVLSSYYYPGWVALVNGKETPIFPVYGFLSGIHITEAGKHTVIFKYRPASVFWGIGLSVLALLILAPTFYFFLRSQLARS